MAESIYKLFVGKLWMSTHSSKWMWVYYFSVSFLCLDTVWFHPALTRHRLDFGRDWGPAWQGSPAHVQTFIHVDENILFVHLLFQGTCSTPSHFTRKVEGPNSDTHFTYKVDFNMNMRGSNHLFPTKTSSGIDIGCNNFNKVGTDVGIFFFVGG